MIPCVLSGVLRLVQPRPSPLWDRLHDAGGRAHRLGAAALCRTPTGVRSGVDRTSRALHAPPSDTTRCAGTGRHQPAKTHATRTLGRQRSTLSPTGVSKLLTHSTEPSPRCTTIQTLPADKTSSGAEPRRACAPRDAAPSCRRGTAAGHQAMEITAALTSGDRYLSHSREHLSARIEERARSAVSSLHPIQRR
jgi:hypothetical protein